MFMKVILFVGLFGMLETLAGPKLSSGKIYKHIIQVTEVGQEDSDTDEEDEMLARTVNVNVKLVGR